MEWKKEKNKQKYFSCSFFSEYSQAGLVYIPNFLPKMNAFVSRRRSTDDNEKSKIITMLLVQKKSVGKSMKMHLTVFLCKVRVYLCPHDTRKTNNIYFWWSSS